MLWAWEKKVILMCFFKHDIICVCAKFEVSPTPTTGFLASDDTFLTNIQKKIFFPQILQSSLPVKTEILKFGTKLSEKWAFTFQNFGPPQFQWIAA